MKLTFTFSGRKNSYGEYVVRGYKDGKRAEELDYHTSDRDDAEGTLALLVKQNNQTEPMTNEAKLIGALTDLLACAAVEEHDEDLDRCCDTENPNGCAVCSARNVLEDVMEPEPTGDAMFADHPLFAPAQPTNNWTVGGYDK